VRPPSNVDGVPHPELPFGRVPLELSTEPRPWVAARDVKRCAAVSAFGIGGVNYHVVLEEAPPPPSEDRRAPFVDRVPPPARGARADRFVVELAPITLPSRAPRFTWSDKHVVLVPDALGACSALHDTLARRGAKLSVVRGASEIAAARARHGAIDAVVDASAFGLDPGLFDAGPEAFARALSDHDARVFDLLREVYDDLAAAPPFAKAYVAVTSLGGDLGLLGRKDGSLLGAAMLGVAKGLKQELPHVVAKGIDFGPDVEPAKLADAVAREVEDGGDRMEVGYAGRRYGVSLRRASFGPDDPAVRALRDGDVCLFSGGGRGVTFECAFALARLGAVVVVTGRTALPSPAPAWLDLEDAAFAELRATELRARCAADRSLTPAAFAREFAVKASQRELHRNLARAAKAGVAITYEVCDVTDAAQVRALSERVRARHGRIDGVVHGAMVETSRSVPKKTRAIVDATMAAKVVGLANLLDATATDPLRVFVGFGSGAGRFGNRGQVDYCAANALAAALLTSRLRGDPRGVHAVTIDWTAWEGTGAAVANPDIAARVRETGVTSITPTEGIYWFLSEIERGRASEIVIFDEPMLHRWPGLGSHGDGEGESAVGWDDRGAPLVPGEWPMIDYVTHRTRDGVELERRLDVARDAFVAQHRLFGTPIVPATFGCEILAEAALATSPGFVVERVDGVSIGVPVKLHRGRAMLLRATARVEGDRGELRRVHVEAQSSLFLHGTAIQQGRLHYGGEVTLRRAGAPHGVPRVLQPTLEAAPRLRSFFHMVEDPVGLGPLFCRAEWIRVAGDEVRGEVRAPRQRDLTLGTAHPIWQLDPLVMDAAFQIAANWDGRTHGYVSVPMGVERITLGRERGRSEDGHVHARVVRVDDPDVLYDVTVASADGDLLLDIRGLRLRRVTAAGAARPEEA
jgi:NAD(P)-dependent dehydrogenase (short-subunit alcohol dehydrogenase family)